MKIFIRVYEMCLKILKYENNKLNFIVIFWFCLIISQCISQQYQHHQQQQQDDENQDYTSGMTAMEVAAPAAGKNQHVIDTKLIDENGNKYETATFNFCPHFCSCLDDYFECKKANLKQVPVLPKWVRNLDLSGNKLDDSVQNTIANLTELISLNLKKNRLQRIPVFKGLLSLEKLNLAHNRIQGVTKESFLSLPNLHEIDLSKNAIRTILPNTFPVTNRLTYLNLNFNAIRTLEENSFEVLRELNELQINHNRLISLPNGIFKTLNNLKKLDLSDNQLEITWSIFKGLDELKALRLRSNNIGNLADGVFHALKSIVTVELDSNHITLLNRQGFYNLTSLTTLTLANNSIEHIEADTWEFTQQLLFLDLSYNNLTEFTKQQLEYLYKLQRLNLCHNNIHHIGDGTFDMIKNLEQLDLSSNRLSWIIEDSPGPFKLLKKLQKLNLSKNNATSINQKAFIGLQSLQFLNLEMNNLTTIQYNAFEPLQQLQKLILNSNHFLCDCNLQWFYNWLKSIRLIGQISVICDYPVNLRGKDLLELKDKDFMCNKSPKPRIIKEPSNQLAIKGTNVSLECSAISSLPIPISVQWKKDNIDLYPNETDTNTIFSSNNTTITTSFLHLSKVNHDHTGKYQCIALNNFGTTYSKKFKITVATYPGFRKVPTNVTLNVGSTARLDCSAYGEPTPQIAWQKDGGNDFPAARERRMHVMPTDDAFFIINAKPSDMGVYTCTAENPAGIIKANATLTVHEAPTFVRPMRSKEVNTGQSSVLECMSSGSPKPTLKWYKDDEPLQLTERHFFAAEGQLLIIVDTKLTDAGIYKCEMENDLGTASGLLTLKVNKSILKSVINVEEVTGIVIITVFLCAVATSIIWVVIIYQTKRSSNSNSNNGGGSGSGSGSGGGGGGGGGISSIESSNNGGGGGGTGIGGSGNNGGNNNGIINTDYNSNMQTQQDNNTTTATTNNNNNNNTNSSSMPLTNLQENSINENYLPIHIQNESRFRLIIPPPPPLQSQSEITYNSQHLNNMENISENDSYENEGNRDAQNGSSSGVGGDCGGGGDVETETTNYLSNSKDSGKPANSNSIENLPLNSSSSQTHSNGDIDNYCQIDNFDKPIIIYRPSVSALFNNNNKNPSLLSQYKINQKQQQQQLKPYDNDSIQELSMPLISSNHLNNIDTSTNNVNHFNSISVPRNSTNLIKSGNNSGNSNVSSMNSSNSSSSSSSSSNSNGSRSNSNCSNNSNIRNSNNSRIKSIGSSSSNKI